MLHGNQTKDPLHSLFSHDSTSYIVTNTQRCKYLASEPDIWFMNEYEQWAECGVQCNALVWVEKIPFQIPHCLVGTFNIYHFLLLMKNFKNIKSSLHFVFKPKVFSAFVSFIAMIQVSAEKSFSKLEQMQL